MSFFDLPTFYDYLSNTDIGLLKYVNKQFYNNICHIECYYDRIPYLCFSDLCKCTKELATWMIDHKFFSNSPFDLLLKENTISDHLNKNAGVFTPIITFAAIQQLYKNKFCYSALTDEFYKFKKNGWCKISCTTILRDLQVVCHGVYQFYQNLCAKDSLSEHSEINKYLIRDLQNKFYIVKQAITSTMDQKKNLIRFNNGVYDLDIEEFRKENPDDYITLSVGYDYDPQQRNEHINKILEGIFPNDRIRLYFLKLVASCLSGCKYIDQRKICALIEQTDITIDAILSLIQCTFGSYVEYNSFISSSFIRSDPHDLFSLIGKRILILNDPEYDNMMMNTTLVRSKYEMDAMQLFHNIIQFEPMFNVFFACKTMPIIKNPLKNGKHLVVKFKFLSEFVNDPNKYNNFETNLSEYRMPFMNILLDVHKILKNEKLIDIPEVI